MKTLLLKSPIMTCLRPLATLESRTSKCVCNFAPVTVYDFFRSARDFADSNLTDPYHCFNRTTRGYFPPEIHSPDLEISDIRPGFELKFVSFLCLGTCVPLSTCSGSSTRTFEFVCGCRCISQTCSTVRTVEMDRQAVTRCYKQTRLHHFS